MTPDHSSSKELASHSIAQPHSLGFMTRLGRTAQHYSRELLLVAGLYGVGGALPGCLEQKIPLDPVPIEEDGRDNDGDGFIDEEDCDEEDPTVHQGAEEVPYDWVDQDCKDGDLRDVDGDGHVGGDGGSDCNDGDDTIHPNADEHCDGVDEDCDSLTDETALEDEQGVGVVEGTEWFVDGDWDGYGADPEEDLNGDGVPDNPALLSCDDATAPVDPWGLAQYVDNTDDCDDDRNVVYPGAPEVPYNDVDEDCENGDLKDVDGDGEDAVVAGGPDCNDDDVLIHTGAPEVCDGVDNDCDNLVDLDDPNKVGGTPTWYRDSDADGYGDRDDAGIVACMPPDASSVLTNDDCDDDDLNTYPAAVEACDGIVNDCNAVDGGMTSTVYPDVDSDGIGGLDCSDDDGDGESEEVGDCRDDAVTINTSAAEVCDGDDNDCNGTADGPTSTDALAYYADVDGDGFGDSSAAAQMECASNQPANTVEDNTDCRDTDATAYPGATEYCDGVDDDCDGTADDSAIDRVNYYADIDGDGYGDDSAAAQTECPANQPANTVTDRTDCDDAVAATHPGASEACEGTDSDCSTGGGSASDEQDGDGDSYLECNDCDDTDASEWVSTNYYYDGDGDTFGTGSATPQCGPTGFYTATVDGDCNDSDVAINPAENEMCDGDDNDCDGLTDDSSAVDADNWYADVDGDLYGDVNDTSPTTACAGGEPADTIDDNTDCDDGDASTYPSATEVCDLVDNDCDTMIDDGATGTLDWYLDTDGDGYGDETSSPTVQCPQPTANHVADGTDCDDADATINPGASEGTTCDNAIVNCASVETLDNERTCETITAEVSNEYGSTGMVDDDGDGTNDTWFAGTSITPDGICTAYGKNQADITRAYGWAMDGGPGVCPGSLTSTNTCTYTGYTDSQSVSYTTGQYYNTRLGRTYPWNNSGYSKTSTTTITYNIDQNGYTWTTNLSGFAYHPGWTVHVTCQ